MLEFAKTTRKIWYGYYKMWNPWATMVFIQRLVMWPTDVFAMPLTLTSTIFFIIILLSTFLWLFFLFRNMAQNNILTEQASLIITHDLEYVLFLYLIRLIFQFDSVHFHRKVSIKKKYKQKNVWYTFQLLKYPVFFSTQVRLGRLRQCSLSSKD